MSHTVLRLEDVPDRRECFVQVLFTDANGRSFPYAQWLTGNAYDDYRAAPESLDSIIASWEAIATRQYYDSSAITPRQARLALLNAGLLDAVESFVATLPKAAQVEWEYANEIRRNWPLVIAAGTALNLSDEQLDALFELAMTL